MSIYYLQCDNLVTLMLFRSTWTLIFCLFWQWLWLYGWYLSFKGSNLIINIYQPWPSPLLVVAIYLKTIWSLGESRTFTKLTADISSLLSISEKSWAYNQSVIWVITVIFIDSQILYIHWTYKCCSLYVHTMWGVNTFFQVDCLIFVLVQFAFWCEELVWKLPWITWSSLYCLFIM